MTSKSNRINNIKKVEDMIKVKGKFITLTVMLLSSGEAMQEEIDTYLENECGLKHMDLDPEEFYDVKCFTKIFDIHNERNAYNNKKALIELGKRAFSTMKNSFGDSPDINTVKDLIIWEAKSFVNNMTNVVPREFIEEGSNYFIIKAVNPYPKEAQIGIWIGVLEEAGIKRGIVKEIKEDIYRISW